MTFIQKLLVASALAAVTFTAPVYAEWRVGAQLGYADSTVDSEGDLTDGSDDGSGGNFGVFGEWRTAVNDRVSLGVHLAFGQSETDYEDSLTGSIDLQNFVAGHAMDVGDVTLNFEAEQGQTLDLLGVVAWPRADFTPFVMFGYSSVEVETEFSITGSGFTDNAFNITASDGDEETLTGYKLVAGVEGTFAPNWIWHAALEYADYGDETFTHEFGAIITEEKAELDQTGVRVGVAYTF